ncbi:MAG: HDOD domain-containing protein [Desulfobacterales bacterium]
MDLINISNLTPGMTLAQDVRDQWGRLLASCDQETTPKLIRVFKIWGISKLWVNESGDQNGQAEPERHPPEDILQKAQEIVRYRFQYNNINHPFAHELFRISCLKKARSLFKSPENNHLKNYFNTETGSMRKFSNAGNKKVNVDHLIEKTLRLETIPDIYYKIIAAINNPEASLDDISQIVSKDITLSAKVLQLVNSSFYSLRQKVDTVTWALALIGTNQLMNIVSGVSAVSLFKNIPSQIVNMASFWEHSIACGTTARLLAGLFNRRTDVERFFVAGLLHDIGRLILVQNLPAPCLDLFKQARKEEIFLFVAETDKFGMDHAHIGAKLALHWNLPETLADMIQDHHLPGKEKVFSETSIINLADIIVNALEIGTSGEFFVPVIEPRVCDELNLNKDILQPVVNQLESQLEDLFQIIYGNPE